MQICYYFLMNRIKDIRQIQVELRQHFDRRGLASTSAIARATGINQSQVSRNLNGHPRRVSSTIKRLCSYAEISIFTEQADPRSSSILMDALGSIWDGSDQHAKLLAQLLFAHQKASL